jgi:4'-phosphopantetheinyl transferase
MRSTESNPDSLQNAIHVWRVQLGEVDASDENLSPRERLRASRRRFDRDRERFVAAHSALRQILGGYVPIPPYALESAHSEHGKPSLARDTDIRFNLSHSEDFALLAVAHGTEVGVDVESASLIVDQQAVAQRSMSDGERGMLDDLPADRRQDSILATWVRKEAVAKGRGDGLGVDLTTIRTQPGQPASATRVMVETSPQDRWFVWDVPVGPSRAGAVAIRRNDVSIRILDHPGPGNGALPSSATSASLTL